MLTTINPRARRAAAVGMRPRWAGGGGSVLDSDPHYPNCAIRIPFEGANGSTSFPDYLGNTWSAVGDAQLTTTTPLVGNSSLLLDGAGDYAVATISNNVVIGTGDFTIRAKIRPASLTNDGEIFCVSASSFSTSTFNIVLEYKTTGALRFSIQDGIGGTNVDISSATGKIVANTTYDIEACADGSTARLYIDGVQVASGAISGTRMRTAQANFRVGFLSNDFSGTVTRYFNGRVDNLIVYQGLCLHPGGTTFTPDSNIVTLPIPRFTSRFTTPSSNDAQGVCTDGQFIWFSSSSTIYKYTKSGTLIASRNVMGDPPTSKGQINGLFIKDNLLRVSCNLYSSVGTSWIADYEPHSLTYKAHRQLVGDWAAEGVCWYQDAWWVVFHATMTLARYTAKWVPAGTYPLSFSITGSSGGYGSGHGYDGLFWRGSYLWVSIHDIYDQKYWDVYYFGNDTLSQVARIWRPTANSHQGICLDPSDATKVWAAERNAGGSDAVALLTVS